MLRINHNLDEVITDLVNAERHLTQQFGPNVMRPELYLEHLRAATRFILGLWLETAEERSQIEPLTQSIVGIAQANGMQFSLAAGGAGLVDLQPGDVSYQDLSALEGEITEWAQLYKDRTAEDWEAYGSDYGALAKHLMAVIANDPKAWTQHFAEILETPGLLQYLAAKNPSAFYSVFGVAGASIPPAKLADALAAVLYAWTDVLGVRLLAVASREVDAAFAGV